MEKRVLISRWLGSFGSEVQAIPIYDEASVSSARQRVRDAGQRQCLGQQLVESAALIASELTHNQLAHARQGYFAVRPVEREGIKGLEMMAADIGPGIERPVQAMQDGPAGKHSLGAGLSAVCRIADEIDFDNRIAEGLCVIARKFETRVVALCGDIAFMGRPFPGEIISGDDGVAFQSETGFLAALSDGLGHGPEAREASNRAIETLNRTRQMDLEQIIAALNRELEATRGCAMNIVRYDKNSRTIECASAGDVHAHLYSRREACFFASTPLILGAGQFPRQKIRIEKAPVEPGSVLVMFTDGLKSRTSLKGQLDILRRPPIAIAQHLLENDSRPDDDVLILVARFLR